MTAGSSRTTGCALLLAIASGGALHAQDAVVFRDGFESTASGEAACFADPDPLNAPEDYLALDLSWEQVFYGQTFPDIDSGGLAPVGSITLADDDWRHGRPVAGTYITVPFVPEAETNYKLEWNRAQTVASRGYLTVHPAHAVYVTLSPCPGDFRLAEPGAPRTDERSPRCRSYDQNGIIYYGTTGGGSACVLDPGQTYYLNILFADPWNLDPTTDTCVEGPLCDANFGDW